MHSRTWLSRLLVGCAAVLVLLAIPTQAQQPKSGGTFFLPVIDNPRMWPVVGGLPNIVVNKVLYSTLVKFNDPDLLPVGDLAERWTTSADGKTWTFFLHRNVKWHDGAPFTADDVVFTVNKVWLNPDIPFYLRGNLDMIDHAEKVDDYTVRLILQAPAYSLPWMLGYLVSILPEHIMKNWTPKDVLNPAEFLKRPIGTGPFKFAEAVPGSHVRLVRNDEYFGGKPYLDAMVFKVVADIEQQLAQVQTGQLDMVEIEPYQVAAIEGNPNIRIHEARQVNYTYVAFNNRMEPFKDRRVRQAFIHAIDRRALLKNVVLGRGVLANHPISPFLQWVYNDKVDGFEYNPSKAKQLLEEAGWKVNTATGIREKNGTPLKITLEVDKGNPAREQTAVITQQYWKAVGADVEIKTSLFNALLNRIRAGDKADVQSFILWYVTPPHPDITAYYGCGQSTNTFFYCNKRLDRLLAEARRTANQETQVALYRQVQELLAVDAPIVFLYYPFELQALSRRVQNWPRLGYRDALTHIVKVWKQ